MKVWKAIKRFFGGKKSKKGKAAAEEYVEERGVDNLGFELDEDLPKPKARAEKVKEVFDARFFAEDIMDAFKFNYRIKDPLIRQASCKSDMTGFKRVYIPGVINPVCIYNMTKFPSTSILYDKSPEHGPTC